MVKKNCDNKAVFIWYRNVRKDRQTVGRTDLLYQYRASMRWRAIKIVCFH